MWLRSNLNVFERGRVGVGVAQQHAHYCLSHSCLQQIVRL